MVKVGLIGTGKMGISHLAILGANPNVKVVGVVDKSKTIIDLLNKYTPFSCFEDHKEMISKEKPEAVFVATPTKFHFPLVKDLLENKIHVFVEKPFCLNSDEGEILIELAKQNKLINQVGYHNKFIGTFKEAKKLITTGSIGEIYHYDLEMNGPVVIKTSEATWRSKSNEGGGCLMDYAAHAIDLINDMMGDIEDIEGVLLKSVFSKDVDDSVYALLKNNSKISGTLNVNWSDETYRKMSTTLIIYGKKGKIIVDTSELKVFLKEETNKRRYSKGWNTISLNELTDTVGFYLRGEEYSSQVQYFIDAIVGKRENTINDFQSAWKTDKIIEKIRHLNKNEYAQNTIWG